MIGSHLIWTIVHMLSLYMAKRSGCSKCGIYWIMLLVGRDSSSIISITIISLSLLPTNGFARCLVQVVYRVHYGFYCSFMQRPLPLERECMGTFQSAHLQMLKTMRLRIAPNKPIRDVSSRLRHLAVKTVLRHKQHNQMNSGHLITSPPKSQTADKLMDIHSSLPPKLNLTAQLWKQTNYSHELIDKGEVVYLLYSHTKSGHLREPANLECLYF